MRLPPFILFPLLLVAAFTLQAEPDKRPNILFCIADDWGRHASIYGDPVVQTPTFDRVAREGALFWQAYCASPSCTPSRASILTGRAVHQLEGGAHLWSTLPAKFAVYPDLLESAGYEVGCEGKGWGPGDFKAGGRTRNPAGPQIKWERFFERRDKTKPFCFWLGSSDPHRPYEEGSGVKAGLDPEKVIVPPYWPDTPQVRSDILDYYLEVQRFDTRVGAMLAQLEQAGELDNTLVVISSDNGMPFPRAKANLYDAGANVPLAVRWPAKAKGGQVFENTFVVLTDLGPTFLEAAGQPIPPETTGRSLLPLLTGTESPAARDRVFLERERHAHVRRGNLSYPVRAVRTRDFLYIRNLRPERWPAGDPELVHSVGEYGDIDGGPTKDAVLALERDPERAGLARLSLGKRPEEELYDLRKDPHQTQNITGNTEYADAQKSLRASLDTWMRNTADPRAIEDNDHWDQHPYTGPAGRDREPRKGSSPR
jgi:arylsulfatase A-like enzyme